MQYYIYALDAEIDEHGDLNYKNKHTFVPAGRCQDIYAANMTEGGQYYNSVLALEFENRNEICPDIRNFTLHQNPWMIKITDGKNFV